jgi:hypothetical protein
VLRLASLRARDERTSQGIEAASDCAATAGTVGKSVGLRGAH